MEKHTKQAYARPAFEDAEDYNDRLVQTTQSALLSMSERMRELANYFSATGTPLNPEDKQLCRMAVTPIVDEIFEEVKVQFLAGLHSDTISDTLQGAQEYIRLFNRF